jgi:phytoene dehydrogenase-like protein
MPIGQRVVLVGGGHNALITAFYLAKGGFKPLVLERREIVGVVIGQSTVFSRRDHGA